MYSKQLNSLVITIAALATAGLMGCNEAASKKPPPGPISQKSSEITLHGLNDTGANKFLDATHAPESLTVSSGTPSPRFVSSPNGGDPVPAFPGQDAYFGRDKSVVDASILNGTKSSNYVALDEVTGAELTTGYDDVLKKASFTNSQGVTVTPGCVKDKVTGLVWEFKNDIHGSMHFKDHTFTWYNPDPNTNGGNSGQRVGETKCTGMSAGSHEGIADDTDGFIQDNNKAKLCGFSDWRLPLVNELVSIYDYGATAMDEMTDKIYFGNLHGFAYHRWAAETLGTQPEMAWAFHMHNGQPEAHSKSCDVSVDAKGNPQQPGFFNGVMLVRGDQ